ncbi:uncharacterized protein [Amphiura filiformis]|uniref:uncharacterized protein n=1 Tax=Amphiura filiformis TaxID=82378 RepID=UPI003B216B6D
MTYQVTYRIDHQESQELQNIRQETRDITFVGNLDATTPVFQRFENPVTLTEITIYPTSCKSDCALRFELYGCEYIPTTQPPVRMLTSRRIIATSSSVSTFQKSATNKKEFTTIDKGLTSTIGSETVLPNRLTSVVGPITGSILGIVVIVVIIVIVVIFCKRRKSKPTNTNAETELAVSPSGNENKSNPGAETYVIKTLQGQQNDNTTNTEPDRSTLNNTEEYAYAYADVDAREKSNQSGSGQSKVQGVENQNAGSLYQNALNKTDTDSQMYTDLKLDEQSNEYETPHIYTQLTHTNAAEKQTDSSPANRNEEHDQNLEIYTNQSVVTNLEK